MQKRTRAVAAAEFRTAPELGEGMAEAYVALWSTVYPIGRSTVEQIDRRAFEDAADGTKTYPIYLEHTWEAGPIGHQTFRADDKGLRATQTYYIDDPRGRSVFRALKAGAYNQHSIGFIPDSIETEQRDGKTLERILKGDLVESSVVARGANAETETVDVRAVAPVAPTPAVDPATGQPLPEDEEKATMGGLMAALYDLLEDADELGVADQLPNMLKQAIQVVEGQKAAQAPPVAPPVPGAVPAPAPVAPRSFPEDLSPSLFRALSA